MVIRTIILAFMIIAAVPACDRSTWPSNQADKYLALLNRVQLSVSVVRLAESTEFELMIENVGPRLYLTRFIHSAQDNTLPKCVLTMDQLACGTCSIELEQDWLMEYRWFPANPDEETRQC